MDKPFINLTPEIPDEDYQRYGEMVAHRAMMLSPPPIAALFVQDRAFIINIYGRDDLNRVSGVLDKYEAGGNKMVWATVWESREVDRVVSAVFEVAEGRSAQDVMREKLGWGSA